jgi:myosin-1
MTRGTLARWRFKKMKAVYTIMNRYRLYKLRSYMLGLVDLFR